MTALGTALTTALTNQALSIMFPNFESMTETDLRPIVEKMENARTHKKCAYSGETFTPDNRFMMIDTDGSIKVGVEKFMQLRAVRDDSNFVLLRLVYEPMNEKYMALKTTREDAERAERERQQVRLDAIKKIEQLAVELKHLNAIDGFAPEPGPFHTMLEKIARAKGATDEELNHYYESLTAPTAEEPAA